MLPKTLGVKLGDPAMSAQCPVCPKADTAGRLMDPQPEGHMAGSIGRRKFLATLGAAALRELGWIEGRTIAIEYRWSEERTTPILN
jgi:hypothetical protein